MLQRSVRGFLARSKVTARLACWLTDLLTPPIPGAPPGTPADTSSDYISQLIAAVAALAGAAPLAASAHPATLTALLRIAPAAQATLPIVPLASTLRIARLTLSLLTLPRVATVSRIDAVTLTALVFACLPRIPLPQMSSLAPLIFAAARSLILSANFLLADPLVPSAVSMILATLQALDSPQTTLQTATALDSSPASALHLLIMLIMTIPLFPNRLPLPVLSQFAAAAPLDKALALIAADKILLDTDSPDRTALLANLIAFTHRSIPSLPQSTLVNYISSLKSILSSFPPLYFSPLTIASRDSKFMSDSDDDDDDNNNTASGAGQRHPQVTIENTYYALDSKMIKWLDIIHSQSHITSLITQIEPVNFPSLTLFLVTLLSHFSPKKNSILGAVLSISTIIPSLWSLVISNPRGLEIFRTINLEGSKDVLACFTLLLECIDQELRIMSDDEFFAKGLGLDMEAITTLAALLRVLISIFYTWSRIGFLTHLVYLRTLHLHCS